MDDGGEDLEDGEVDEADDRDGGDNPMPSSLLSSVVRLGQGVVWMFDSGENILLAS